MNVKEVGYSHIVDGYSKVAQEGKEATLKDGPLDFNAKDLPSKVPL